MGYQGVSGAPTVFPTARRSARGKPPCKYGPRGPDGYCPKKPRRARAASAARTKLKRETAKAVLGGLPTAPKRERAPKTTKAERLANRRLESAAVRTTQRLGGRAVQRVAKSTAGQRAVGAALKTAAYLGTPLTALKGSAALGAVGLAIAAGTASFLLTGKILKGIRDRKERRQQAAFEAAQQMRATRLDAEARLGRPLTVPELQRIKRAFDLDNLMEKARL